jgi:hypothetical protein
MNLPRKFAPTAVAVIGALVLATVGGTAAQAAVLDGHEIHDLQEIGRAHV